MRPAKSAKVTIMGFKWFSLLVVYSVFGTRVANGYKYENFTDAKLRNFPLNSDFDHFFDVSGCAVITDVTFTNLSFYWYFPNSNMSSAGNQPLVEFWTSECEFDGLANVNQSKIEENTDKITAVYIRAWKAQLTPHYFCHFTNLQILDLAKNRLTNISQVGLNFDGNEIWSNCGNNLLLLDLSENNLPNLKNNTFGHLKKLETLILHSCNLQSIESGVFAHLSALKKLSLRNNNLTILPPSLFILNKNIFLLDLSENLLDENSLLPLQTLHELKVLNMSNNQVQTLKTTTLIFSEIMNLKYTFSYSNYINRIVSHDLEDSTKISYLHLNSSQLVDTDKSPIEPLTNLEVFHLENNNIEELAMDAFSKLTNLRELYLSDNNIKFLSPGHFNSLKALQVLHLHSNKLTEFDVWKLKSLNPLMKLTLHDNPWSCECNFVINFQTFLQSGSGVIQENRISCFDKDTKHSMLYFMLSHCFPTCNGNTQSRNIAITVIVILVCLNIIGILIFIYRKEIQILAYYSPLGLKLCSLKKSDPGEKMYDAFVSYSSKDSNFITDEVIHHLEGNSSYNLCLHERDFACGMLISEGVFTAVENSSCTIIILTEHFTNSEWCMFEFKVAHNYMLSNNCHKVIIIVLNDIPKNVDKELGLYLKTHTYLKWGGKLFWKQLYSVMPKKQASKEPTEALS